MNEKASKLEAITKISPGDVLSIETQNGTRHVQVTHIRAPYPDVLRAILPAESGTSAGQIAKGKTAFTAMVELGPALRRKPGTIKLQGHATIPQDSRAFPLFRLPIRNREGDIVYWWTWDGEGLKVAPEAGDTDLPIREITSIDRLIKRLADLG